MGTGADTPPIHIQQVRGRGRRLRKLQRDPSRPHVRLTADTCCHPPEYPAPSRAASGADTLRRVGALSGCRAEAATDLELALPKLESESFAPRGGPVVGGGRTSSAPGRMPACSCSPSTSRRPDCV